jgi:hypothetical protein
MIKDLSPPTEAEEYRNTAEIPRDLAAQVRFDNTRNALVSLAETGWPMLRVKSPGRSPGRPREQRPTHRPSIRTAHNSSTREQVPRIDWEEKSLGVASRGRPPHRSRRGWHAPIRGEMAEMSPAISKRVGQPSGSS